MKSPELSFGIVADCQYADAPDEQFVVRGTNELYKNCYRSGVTKLAEAVEEFNQHDLEFIIHLGDFTDRNLDDADLLHLITNRARAPLWHVLGNHEFWRDETTTQHVLGKYGMDAAYYSREIRDNRFIVLDTNQIGPLEHAKGTPEWHMGMRAVEQYKKAGAINAFVWNDGIDERQMGWLDAELTEAEKHDQKAFLFSHHPVFPPHVLNALNDSEILRMIDSHDNVKAFINGHFHAGNYGERNGVPYVTIPAMMSEHTNAFALADLYNDKLHITGYGRAPSHDLNF